MNTVIYSFLMRVGSSVNHSTNYACDVDVGMMWLKQLLHKKFTYSQEESEVACTDTEHGCIIACTEDDKLRRVHKLRWALSFAKTLTKKH